MLGARSVVWLAGLLVLAVGCGGGDDGEGGRGGGGAGTTPPPAGSGAGGGMAGTGSEDDFDAGSAPDRNDVTAGELCDRLATIQCAGAAHCCDTFSGDFAACKSTALATCNSELRLDTIAGDARVGFDAAATSAAFMSYEMRASTCDDSIPKWAVSSSGFMSGFTGTVAADGDCMPMDGLAAGMSELFAALASCNRAAGLACLPAMDGWKCAARAPAGGACILDFNCQDGLYCDGAVFGNLTSGTCTTGKAAGADCGFATECASLVCAKDKCAAAGDDQAVFCL